MPLATDTALQVRFRIRDQLRYDAEQIHGDGTASAFKLKQGRPFSVLSGTGGTGVTASIAVAAGWSATGTTAVEHVLGRVIFGGAISANSAILMDYQWSVFSDEEIGWFTAVGGSVVGAALEAVRTLESDAARLARWGSPDGSTYDPTQTFANLAAMKAQLLAEKMGGEEGPAGSMESWSENQSEYL